MNKKVFDRIFGPLLVLALVLGLVAPLQSLGYFQAGVAQASPLANPHHPTGDADADCEGYTVSGEYVGGSGYRWLEWDVTLSVDGIPENIVGNWNGVSPGFEIFSRSGSGPHDVVATGWIKMFADVFTPAVSADDSTWIFDNNPNSQGNSEVDVVYSNSDNDIVATGDGGYLVTKVELDVSDDGHSGFFTYFSGSQATVSLNPNPGTTINNAKITVHRNAVPASHAKGALLDTYTYNLNFVGQCVQHIPVTLCHATPPDTAANGWNEITTDDDGALGHAAQHSADIIPAFQYYGGSFPGLNLDTLFGWGATGQQVLDNGCEMPPQPHQYSYELDYFNHCDRWERSARLLDFDQSVGPYVVIDGAEWPWNSNHFLDAGEVPAQTYTGVDLGQGQVFDIPFPAMPKPEGCQEIHQVNWDVDVDCEGVTAWYWVDGGEDIVFFTHAWTDPSTTESVDIPEFPIPTNSGELYSQIVVGGQEGIAESEECYELCSATTDWVLVETGDWTWDPVAQDFYRDLTYERYDLYDQEHECARKVEKEWQKYELCSELSEPVYGEWSAWTFDPDTGMMKRSRTVTVYDKYNEEYVCCERVETEYDDYQLCSETSEPVYGEWSEWVFDPATGMMKRERTVTIYDAHDPEHVCSQTTEKEYKELEGFTVAFVVDPCVYRDGQSWATLNVTITGKGTVYIYNDGAVVAKFEENGSVTLPAGKYTWKLSPAEGYQVVGPDHGDLDLITCDPDKPVRPPTNGQGFTLDVVGAVTDTPIEPGKESGEPGGLERMLERYGANLLQPFLERIQVWAAAMKAKAWWNPKAESFFLRTLTHRPVGDRTYEITVDVTSQGPALSDGYPYLWMGLPHHGVTGALFYGRKVRMGPPVCLEPGTHIPMHTGFGATAWVGATPVIGTAEEMAEVDPNNLTMCQDLGAMLYRDAVHAGLVTADSWWIYGNNSLENALGEEGATSLYAYYLGENPDLSQIWETGMVYSPAAVEPWSGREGGLPVWGWNPTEGFNANPEKVRAMFNTILPPADYLGQAEHQRWAEQYEAAGFDRTWTLTQRINHYVEVFGDLR